MLEEVWVAGSLAEVPVRPALRGPSGGPRERQKKRPGRKRPVPGEGRVDGKGGAPLRAQTSSSIDFFEPDPPSRIEQIDAGGGLDEMR